MQSTICKVGYVFDLRVDEDYQGHGIGKTLTTQIEECCELRGVKYLYLTVNSDNTKAKALYTKRGFVLASSRAPTMHLLVHPEAEDRTIVVERLPIEQALQMTTKAYDKADLALGNLETLFRSELYEGTFIARRGESFAGVSTWNGSYFTGFKIERLFFPIAWWGSVVAKSMYVFVAAYGLYWWVSALQVAWTRAHAIQRPWEMSVCGVMSLMTLITTFGCWRVWPAVKFVTKKIASKSTKLRHRVFGPFGSGPLAEQEDLMRAVLKRIHNTARSDGYAISICNLDKRYTLRRSFPTSRLTTTFLYKRLSRDANAADLSLLSPDNFFDPRDL